MVTETCNHFKTPGKKREDFNRKRSLVERDELGSLNTTQYFCIILRQKLGEISHNI